MIPGIAAGLFFIGLGAELLMHDREKAQKVELAIRKKQKEIKQLQKEKNTKAMMDANKELMGLMSQNFKLRMRTMLITMPLFLIVFWLLSGMLSVAPLYAGQATQMGVDVRNLGQSPQDLKIEAVSPAGVTGTNARNISLDDKGDEGDHQQIWWNVTPQMGEKEFTVKITSKNSTESKPFPIVISQPGALDAGFKSLGDYALGKSVQLTTLYKSVEVNILGINLGWFWWYFLSFLVMSAVLSPVKNKLLWGHYKGIKHIEKMESMKEKGYV